ncbi:hypothetical protein [Rhizobium rhizogenes]|uniref:hypothetical protein n=1 Tax=Rhizobium rhizogenes TaxID=359 RepID=UPI00226D4EB3|nr:hypothetical protein [Rhizobium rhizogenes]
MRYPKKKFVAKMTQFADWADYAAILRPIRDTGKMELAEGWEPEIVASSRCRDGESEALDHRIVSLNAMRDSVSASDETTGGVVSSDAVLSGSGVASKPVAMRLTSTVGVYNLPEWAGHGRDSMKNRSFVMTAVSKWYEKGSIPLSSWIGSR